MINCRETAEYMIYRDQLVDDIVEQLQMIDLSHVQIPADTDLTATINYILSLQENIDDKMNKLYRIPIKK